MSHRLYTTSYYGAYHLRVAIVARGMATVDRLCDDGIAGAPEFLYWSRDGLPRPRRGQKWRLIVVEPKVRVYVEERKRRRRRFRLV